MGEQAAGKLFLQYGFDLFSGGRSDSRTVECFPPTDECERGNYRDNFTSKPDHNNHGLFHRDNFCGRGHMVPIVLQAGFLSVDWMFEVVMLVVFFLLLLAIVEMAQERGYGFSFFFFFPIKVIFSMHAMETSTVLAQGFRA